MASPTHTPGFGLPGPTRYRCSYPYTCLWAAWSYQVQAVLPMHLAAWSYQVQAVLPMHLAAWSYQVQAVLPIHLPAWSYRLQTSLLLQLAMGCTVLSYQVQPILPLHLAQGYLTLAGTDNPTPTSGYGQSGPTRYRQYSTSLTASSGLYCTSRYSESCLYTWLRTAWPYQAQAVLRLYLAQG